MSTNDVLQLQEPLTDGGIRAVNFFNGRLLSAKDLSREQQARREADARLGLALGEGVAYGLEVDEAGVSSAHAPVLRVRAGLALNRLGQTLRLVTDTQIALTRRFDAVGTDCLFGNCTAISGGTYIAGAGVYVLTVAPAASSEGRAATNGIDPTQVRCNSDATVEAVQFRLVVVSGKHYAGLDPGSSQFRNQLAYRCLGAPERAQSLVNPWQDDPAAYGLIDALRAEGLDAQDVPLALLFWTAEGLQYIDRWAVRRALLRPDARSRFAFIARGRRLVEADAMCGQFEDHLADLLAATANPAGVVATEHFRYLPPFGLVPLQCATARGFNPDTFFAGLEHRPPPGAAQVSAFIDGRLLGALREQALALDPIETTSSEFSWVYQVWQGVKAVRDDLPVQPLAVFASGLLPEPAIARLDLARLDYSNFVSCCGGS